MIISLIAAMSDNRVIGYQGKLPWHIPADLTRFKEITMGHTVAMGTRTFHSIGHPLPGRRNIVVSRSGARFNGCEVARSLKEAVALVTGDEELFVCGGAELYREALLISQRIYLTVIHAGYPGDVYFPEIPESFVEVHREERPNANPPLSFLVYEKADQDRGGHDPDDLRRKGFDALGRKLYFLARSCFEETYSHQESPEIASHLAYCLAKSGGDTKRALHLAEKALGSEPHNLTFLLNLGRVQILAGNKERGLTTLRRGIQLGGAEDFQAELAKWGTRTPPPIPSLPRSHPLNKYLGMLRYKLRRH